MRQQVANDVQLMLSGGAPIPAAELQPQRKGGGRVWVYSSHLLIHNVCNQAELYCAHRPDYRALPPALQRRCWSVNWFNQSIEAIFRNVARPT